MPLSLKTRFPDKIHSFISRPQSRTTDTKAKASTMRAPWVVHEGYLLCKPQENAASTHNPTHALAGGSGAHAHADANGSDPSPLLLHPFKNGARLGLYTNAASSKKLVERYVVLYMNRKMEIFEATPLPAVMTKTSGNDEAVEHEVSRVRVGEPVYVGAFAGWDGGGLLKVGESYGLELRVDPKPHGSGRNTTSMHVVAFNRVDLDKWCRAIVAVLDPQSAAGEEVRREHRRIRKEEKRLEQEREEKIRRWREMKIKQAMEERERMLAREEEISNMTPLERVDGLGSLDEDTAEFLEKRKLRLQKRQAPSTGRVNKAAYRKRIEDAAGGKLENMQPLQPKIVEAKSRVRVELPLPGQFIEAAGTASTTHRIGLPNSKDRTRLGSSSSEGSSLENPSDTSSTNSLMSSGHSGSSSSQMKHTSNGRRSSFVPPPPPPLPHALTMIQHRESSSRSSFVPPPPPPRSGSGFVDLHQDDKTTRLSRTGSFRGSLYNDDDENDRRSEMSRASFSQSRRRLSGVDRDKQGMQDSLAAILSGRKPTTAARRDSIDSTFSATSGTKERKKKKDVNGTSSRTAATASPVAEPTISNAFAASLAAIRRNRADTMDETSNDSIESPVKRENGNARNRKRDTQLSSEGKELLKKAMTGGDSPVTKANPKANGRKGLFDDSSSESDDSDAGLFATGKGRSSAATIKRVEANGKPTRRSSTTPTSSHSSVGVQRTGAGGFGDDDDDDDDSDATDMSRSGNGNSMFAKNRMSSPNSTASIGSGNLIRQPSKVSVALVSSVVQNEGKKPAGFFTFAFRVGAFEHTFTNSYNEMEMIHSRLSMEYKNDSLPKFPSKHRLRNNTKPENMQKRALEFVEYFQQLVAVPGILTNQRFVFEFRIDERFARALSGEIANEEMGSSSSASSRKPQRTNIPVSPMQKSSSSQPPRSSTRTTKQLFAGDDSESDDDSDSDNSVAPPSRVQPRRSEQLGEPPRAEPRVKKASKPSKKEFAEPEPTRRSRRPSSAASRVPSESPAPAAKVAVAEAAPAPKITGLPPRPNLFGGGRGDLLAAIRQGAELRKTDDSPAASASAPGSASALRPTPKVVPSPPASAPAASISEAITNAMASRRIHIEYEEAHSGDEDSDDDWD